ncbi:MAG: extracellular solute-binding protein [Anaerolineae bacterium]|nr:extracellular solute-binding protein [Anaerolineae bacterium]
MNFLHNNWAARLGLLLMSVTITLVAGCQGVTLPGEINQALPTVQPTTMGAPVTTPTLVITPLITATPTPENEGLTLTFWTVEAISPQAPAELGTFMAGSLRTFEANNPDLKVKVLLKKPSGKGGILDFLRTAREAAPTILPDVAIMNATDLTQAQADGLLQTLDNRLDRSIVQDLLPAARKMGTVDERLVGVPLSLEMEHTIYNTATFTTTPILWSDVLSSNTRYLFPAKGTNGLVNDATLAQYFSAEGSFHNDQGTLQIDDRVLRRVLTFYQQALEIGIIDSTILDAATSEELWPIYLEDQEGLAQISVRQYLTDREALTNSTFTALPVPDKDSTPVTISHGWALVLITDDLERQRAALRLIEWFLSTSNNATWNSINKSIPSRDTAFQQLAGNDPYWAFLTEQLNTAQPQPGFAGYDQLGRIFQQAVEQVLRGEATPQEATATAVDALTP